MSGLTILVTTGSDHHPFDRMIGWVDTWLENQRLETITCVFQHGTAAVPQHGQAHAYLPHPELQQRLREADAVVTQGGPMGIVESRACGVKPIVVPRLARLGEVVDDHQVAFCRQLMRADKLVLAEDSAALWSALDAGLAEPGVYAIEPNADESMVAKSVARFGELVAALPPRRSILSGVRRRER